MEKAPCLFTFQKRWDPGGLRKPQTSAQLFGMDPGPHNGVGPGGVGKAQSENTSSIVLILSRLRQRQAAPLKSPATKSMFLRDHKSTNGLDDFLGNTFLLGVDVADMQGQHSKELLTTDCNTTKRGT